VCLREHVVGGPGFLPPRLVLPPAVAPEERHDVDSFTVQNSLRTMYILHTSHYPHCMFISEREHHISERESTVLILRIIYMLHAPRIIHTTYYTLRTRHYYQRERERRFDSQDFFRVQLAILSTNPLRLFQFTSKFFEMCLLHFEVMSHLCSHCQRKRKGFFYTRRILF